MHERSDDADHAQFLKDCYDVTSREELTQIYDEWADSYDADAKTRHSAQPRAVATVFCSLNLNKATRILDIGAGTGLIGEGLKKHGYLDISALDPSVKMLEMARCKGIYKSYYPIYLGEKLSFSDESFDAIVASGIFTPGHVGAAVFPELNRILTTSGTMVFSMNTKLLKDPEFETILHQGECLGWQLENVAEPFSMMDHEYSGAQAVVVTLCKCG
ncbi:class I SAM-dependent methyltransferase [Roseovarius sp. EL26]|uniref:class I SAM-dependent DNA methyltransferase n=1 Tax=Roseovarius sp. EL26 TaxID=2126672 RepID=UPI000EA0F725|nr:class I SAM-dependent methyltransferase [Roseovarius sp. EL26]